MNKHMKNAKSFINNRSRDLVEIGLFSNPQSYAKSDKVALRKRYVKINDVLKYCYKNGYNLDKVNVTSFIRRRDFTSVRYTKLFNALTKINPCWFNDIKGKKVVLQKTHEKRENQFGVRVSNFRQLNSRNKAWFTTDKGLSWSGLSRLLQNKLHLDLPYVA